MSTDIAAPKRHGIAVLWDTLIAPNAAFEELKTWPHWGWAFLLTCVFGMVGSYIQIPAAEHVTVYTYGHDPRFATMTADQLESAKKIGLAITRFTWVGYPLIVAIAVGFAATLLLVANAIGKGSANFMRIFGLCANVAFLNFGIGYLLHGVIIALRGPEGFQTTGELLSVVPNLGWLMPGAAPKILTFFTAFNVFQLWSIALLAFGMRSISGVSAVIAWTAPILMAILGALFAAAAVR